MSFAMSQQDDGTINIEETKDGFGIFETYEEACERALEIMIGRREALTTKISSLRASLSVREVDPQAAENKEEGNG